MNLRQVRKKIKTVSNVKKITRAMQLVSAIKMKRAQQEVIEGRPYRETLENLIKIVVEKIDPKLSHLLRDKDAEKELVILISSNKGLCGAFNLNLFNFSLKNVDFNKSDFVIIGKKGAFFANKMGAKIIADFSDNQAIVSVSAVLKLALERFLKHEYRKVSVLYNKFISTLRTEPLLETILPVKFSQDTAIKMKEEYLIEPRPEKIIDAVLQSFVENKLRGAILEAAAGEHSNRMMAMKNATDNATDITLELTMQRNKLRQQKITYELLDMLTAKESVESGD